MFKCFHVLWILVYSQIHFLWCDLTVLPRVTSPFSIRHAQNITTLRWVPSVRWCPAWQQTGLEEDFGGPLYRRIPHCLSLMFAASGKQCVQHAVCTDIQLLCDYLDANLCSEYSRSETDCGIDCLTTMMEDKLCSKFWNRETEKKKKKHCFSRVHCCVFVILLLMTLTDWCIPVVPVIFPDVTLVFIMRSSCYATEVWLN